jgi:predicted RecB family endonuclease
MPKNGKSIYFDADTHTRLIEKYGDYGNKELLEVISLGLDVISNKSISDLKEEEEEKWKSFVVTHLKRINAEREEEIEFKLEQLRKNNSEAKIYFEKVMGELTSDPSSNILILDKIISSCKYIEMITYFNNLREKLMRLKC